MNVESRESDVAVVELQRIEVGDDDGDRMVAAVEQLVTQEGRLANAFGSANDRERTESFDW